MTPKRNSGPFLKRFFLSDQKIEALAKSHLESLHLMPSSPSPVQIEKYCERRWHFAEDYRELDRGILGCASFSDNGVVDIAVSRDLCEDASRIGIVRTRSTLAHEIGHGELHADAYAAKICYDRDQGGLFSQAPKNEIIKIACREEQIHSANSYEWWETQANRYMVAVLLPKHLLREAVENWIPHQKNGGFRPIARMIEDEISSIFEVSKEMARIAGEAMYESIMAERSLLKASYLAPH